LSESGENTARMAVGDIDDKRLMVIFLVVN